MSKRPSLAQSASIPDPSATAPPAAPPPAELAPIAPDPVPDSERHSRKCLICHHPDRDLIEDDFIHWVRPQAIVVKYDLRDRSQIYRHARALGLDYDRRRNLRHSLEPFIESAECVRITAASVISAIRAFSLINDDGHWEEPPREFINTKKPYFQAPAIPQFTFTDQIERAKAQVRAEIEAEAKHKAPASSSESNLEPQTSNIKPLIATPPKLKPHVTPTKQRTARRSNRHNPTHQKRVLLRSQRGFSGSTK